MLISFLKMQQGFYEQKEQNLKKSKTKEKWLTI